MRILLLTFLLTYTADAFGQKAAARRERAEWRAQRLSLRRPDRKSLARLPELK